VGAALGSGLLSTITRPAAVFASEESEAKAKALAKQMAVVTFTKKIDEGTDKAFKLAKKGDLLGALKQWDAVIQVYENGGDGVVLGPQALYRLAKTLGQRADVLAQLGKVKKSEQYFRASIDDYKKSISMVPNQELRIKLATALQALGDYAEAEKEFTAVLAGGPANDAKGRALNSRGLARERLGKWKEAIEDFQEASEATRGTPEPLANMALAKFQVGDSKGALDIIAAQQKSSPLGPAEGAEDLPAALAAIVFAGGEKDKALKDLAKVTDPRYRDLRYVSEGRLWPPKLVEAHKGLLEAAKAAAATPAPAAPAPTEPAAPVARAAPAPFPQVGPAGAPAPAKP